MNRIPSPYNGKVRRKVGSTARGMTTRSELPALVLVRQVGANEYEDMCQRGSRGWGILLDPSLGFNTYLIFNNYLVIKFLSG